MNLSASTNTDTGALSYHTRFIIIHLSVVFEIIYFTSSYCFAIIVIIDVVFINAIIILDSIIVGFLQIILKIKVFIKFLFFFVVVKDNC